MNARPFHHYVIAIALMAMGMQACQNVDDYEMIYITRANKDWMIDSSKYKTVTMVDSLSNPEVFNLDEYQHNGLSYSTSGSFFNKTGYQYESNTISYSSNKTGNMYMEIQANKPPESDRLSVHIGFNFLSYDFGSKSITGYTLMTKDKGTMFSSSKDTKPQFLDSLIVQGTTYYDAMSIVLSETLDNLHDSTIIELTLAKHVGILRYKYNNGATYERITQQ